MLGSSKMKNNQSTKELQSSTLEPKTEPQNNQSTEAAPPIQDSVSVSAAPSNDGRKVSRQDIELVQNLIERCLQLYMNKDEVVKTLLTRARIDPGFTTLVWQKLEEENAEFFRAYYIRLKLKKQIIVFNHLLEHQYNLMKYNPPPPVVQQQQRSKVPLVPLQNGIHVNNMPMGYPVLQSHHHPQMSMASSSHHHHLPHHHLPHHSMGSGMVNGVPATGNFHPMKMNSGNDMVMDTTMADPTPMIQPNSNNNNNNGGGNNNNNNISSEMPMSPASVASSGHFPFAASDIGGMDTSGLDSAFTSDVATSVGLQLGGGGSGGGAGNSRGDSSALIRGFDQIPWNFSLSDLSADLVNLGDLGALGNYPSSPFLPSDSEILLDSPEQDDIEEFFVDSVPGPPCSQSDEDNKP